MKYYLHPLHFICKLYRSIKHDIYTKQNLSERENNIKSKFFAYIEKDFGNDCYVAIVPGLPGVHTQANILNELQIRLKEIMELCLEEMDHEERQSLPEFIYRSVIN
jgi:predicted RNase H-like HicB family nuclease